MDINDHINEHMMALSELDHGSISLLAHDVRKAILRNQKVLLFGNGGSAADAQHLAAELIIRFEKNRRAFPAISLTSDSSVVTACANDYGYENIFSRQIAGLGNEGDIAIGFSGSGRSENVLNGLKKAKEKKLVTAIITGSFFKNSPILQVDHLINIQSERTAIVQEVTIVLIHYICMLIEADL